MAERCVADDGVPVYQDGAKSACKLAHVIYTSAMSKLKVLVPTAEPRVQHWPLAPRPGRLSGARIGWLDNMKANAGELLREVEALLRRAGHDFEVVVDSKNATEAAPEAVMAHLKTCDAVVLAIAD